MVHDGSPQVKEVTPFAGSADADVWISGLRLRWWGDYCSDNQEGIARLSYFELLGRIARHWYRIRKDDGGRNNGNKSEMKHRVRLHGDILRASKIVVYRLEICEASSVC